MHATIDDNHLKDLMKIALMELLEEHPAMLRGLMAEALEDMTTERPRHEREDDDEDDDPIKERGRRSTTRSRRQRTPPPPGFSDQGSESSQRRSNERATPEFATDGVDASTHWDLNEEASATEDSHLGATSDYGSAFDPFFKKSPSQSSSAYGSAPPASPSFHNRARTTSPQIPLSGSDYLSRGFTLLLDPDLRPYIVLPMATSIIFFSIAVWVGMGQFGAFSGWTTGYLPFWLGWIDWLLWPFFTIAPVAMIFYFFTLVANIIAAPFNALLAEKVSRQLNGLPMGGGPGFGTAILRVPSSLKEEWRKSMWFLLRALILLIFFFIPLVNKAAPLVWTLFSAWSLALKYLDYPVASQDLEFDETRALAAENRWLVLGFGGAVLLITIVPVLNFIAMPAAVAGASALWTERMALRRNMSI